MDMIFNLLELLINASLNRKGGKQAPAVAPPPRSQPGAYTPARPNPAPAQTLAPQNKFTPQDPVYDGERWRRAVTLLAVIVLVMMVVAWWVYTQGSI